MKKPRKARKKRLLSRAEIAAFQSAVSVARERAQTRKPAPRRARSGTRHTAKVLLAPSGWWLVATPEATVQELMYARLLRAMQISGAGSVAAGESQSVSRAALRKRIRVLPASGSKRARSREG